MAQILAAAGTREDVIIAGLLHDTLEDTTVTSDELLELFGADVLKLVAADGEDKTKSWEQRKQGTIDYVSTQATEEELTVVCADKISILRSLCASYAQTGDAVWKSFKRGADKPFWYCHSLGEVFNRMLAGSLIAQEYQALCIELFGKP